MPNRRQFLASSAAALALASIPRTFASAAPLAAGRAPNIVLILADDLGYGELGVYGQKKITTPRIDALAAEGLRFTQAYSGAPICAPSRCSLLTGLHTGHTPVRTNPQATSIGFRERDTTIAEVLRSRGYRTGCIGKWGFGPEQANQASHPNARGFEEFYGYIDHQHAHQYYPAYLWHNGVKEAIPGNANGAKGTFSNDLIEEHALDFIDTHADEPFFLYLSPTIPHFPNVIPAKDMGAYGATTWTGPDKAHAAQVTRMDTMVGKVVDRLKSLGIEQDTLVLISSDNGPHEEGGPEGTVNPVFFDANGPLRGYKRNLYEGGVRIPLIAWGPGKVTPGTTDRPTPQYDLLPTFAELSGAPAPGDLDGVSIAALLGGGATAPHPYMYWMRDDPTPTPLAAAEDNGRYSRFTEAVRKDNLKAVRFAPARDRNAPDSEWELELYNLAADPGETQNIAAANAAAVTELTKLMRNSWIANYTRKAYGVKFVSPPFMLPGKPYTVSATLGNASASAWANPQIALTVPSGWQTRPTTPTGAASLAAGGVLNVTWEVTPPATATMSDAQLNMSVKGTATFNGVSLTFGDDNTVKLLPPPPTAATTYLSDLPWVSATNGWGPVERDMSGGSRAAGDGTPISLRGTVYAKGLGVHAKSDIVFHLGGKTKRMTAYVGIDDFSARLNNAGGVRARVFGDGVQLFDSGPITAATAAKLVDVNTTGVRMLRLLVEDANGSPENDHTSWADAKVTM